MTKRAISDLAIEATRSWLRTHLHALDPVAHVTIHPLVRPGSPDLVELFRRQREAGVWLANDTSCGVGHAPLSTLERTVLEVERALTASTTQRDPACGEDVKVMGIRRGGRFHLTIAAAVVDRVTPDIAAYRVTREWIADRAGAVKPVRSARKPSSFISNRFVRLPADVNGCLRTMTRSVQPSLSRSAQAMSVSMPVRLKPDVSPGSVVVSFEIESGLGPSRLLSFV